MAVKRNQRILRPEPIQWRFQVMLAMIGLVFFSLVGRAAFIQVVEPDRLRHEGDLRSLRVSHSEVQRGNITDRNGVELAVSVPVQTVWADPLRMHEQSGLEDMRRWQALADVFQTPVDDLLARVDNPQRRFVYLKRMVTPAVAEYVRQLDIPGVYLQNESRRFYPTGEINSHIIGVTNIDGEGLDGIEAVYDGMLTGTPGQRQYRKDGQGRVIEELEVRQAEYPQNVRLSIDQRIQAMAYRELKKAVSYHGATSGSLVAVDVHTGEVLAMVNSPSYNPNNRQEMLPHLMRNRAITDTFEPGSTVKPLVMLEALRQGVVDLDSTIDTSPGWMRLGGRRVQDARNYGELSLAEILQHSSNVAISKLALSIDIDDLLHTYAGAGFGSDTGINLIGESMGLIRHRTSWSDFEVATLSYGYGLGTTTMQLAQMYAILGNGGVQRPLSVLALENPHEGRQVFDPELTEDVLRMMESVVSSEGTGRQARVRGYRVAGKTGTTRKAVPGGYGDEYVGLFAGVIPASNPRIAIAVMINEPEGDAYHGGSVAAPLFSTVAEGSMRILNVAPDDISPATLRSAGFGGQRD
ncbi:peptidoglycan glycosyltransferase FtsI [Aliidiomarina sedimenti]|uniref:Peptidoglycan D,D-transpeptidase FtsI n=1 Tax=Aliidiomarina sedimenti TaxID=1933879 RepID=A0ABY0BZM2_9GAMM|nr:penicillin-binding transpeptidase domain-containing protein [Aliidiomarina sedimenti]RUO30570.1 peptidoglycan glycosyltransferase FtsI [Aliidiomarina sedimenti]